MNKLYVDFLTSISEKVRPDIVKAIELPDKGFVADVGGGHGHDLLAFLEAREKLRGVVFERRSMVELVDKELSDPKDVIYSKYPAAVKQRVKTVKVGK